MTENTGTDLTFSDQSTTMQAHYTGAVSSWTAFPEDRWEDVPRLTDDDKKAICDFQRPFKVLDIFNRPSDYANGKEFWVLIVQFYSDQIIVSFALSKQEEKYDRGSKLRYLFDCGASEIGPFTLKEVDTGKGNPFIKLVAADMSTVQASLETLESGKRAKNAAK